MFAIKAGEWNAPLLSQKGDLLERHPSSCPEVYDGVTVDVTPQYFQVALGTTQAFDASTPPQLVQNMRQMGFHHCPRVAAAIYPVHVHRDVLCLLPRNHGPEHVYLWMVFMGLLRHLDPTATRLHSLVLCSSIPARPCFLCPSSIMFGILPAR